MCIRDRPPPPPDSDETVFFDSSDVEADDPGEPATVVREKPEEVQEKTQMIGGYEVIKLLGKGGFGSVWKARSKEGEIVAVKVLNQEVLDNERAVRKFFHEAIILSRLDHPNICRFIDFFPHEGNYAIVMDFVQGIDVKDLLEKEQGPLPVDKARRISAQTLDALHYAHLKNVLHRDIKPENISLDQEENAKVMDFGIAKLSSSESHQTSLFMISPAYTAPERFDAKKTELVDHRSDIYSLGLAFYEMFTGAHPFQTTNPTEMIVHHLNTVPTPPEEVADVPTKISDAILRSLEKDPDDRFKDFAAFKMSMIGEPPRLTAGGTIEFSGQYCKTSIKLLKNLIGIIKKNQKQAKKFKILQEGKEIHLMVETLGGNTIRITRHLDHL